MFNMFCGVWGLKTGDPSLSQERQQQLIKLHVCIKLFFVMGITWIANIISTIIRSAMKLEAMDVKEYVIFFQIINSLQVFT